MRFSLGLDDIRYESGIPRSTIRNLVTLQDTIEARAAYDIILAQLFTPGSFGTFSFNMGKDAKNHPMHPTRGYTWILKSLLAFPGWNSKIGFHKVDLDAHWFTPLIGEFDLVLHLHGYFGIVSRLHKHLIPYRELFHIGGQASVRGFLFGQIGPQFRVVRSGNRMSDSIGGNKTFFVNVELIFPIMQDFSLKGLVFYDGGAGWDNPYVCCKDIPEKFITNNNLSYRHSVGIGVRVLNPMPVKIDWGFKLDTRRGENTNEIHFSMSYDW
jgi:outer membrane protein insertion porin family